MNRVRWIVLSVLVVLVVVIALATLVAASSHGHTGRLTVVTTAG